jgi:uncharacterized protein involved in exopolysaccharide biosynthesis
MYEQSQVATDTVDVADVVRVLRRQWRAVIAFVALGTVGAAAVVLFAPRQFEGRASLLAKPGTGSSGTSIVGRMSGIGELLGGLSELGAGSGLETELQLLRSRAIAGQVVDSFQLNIRVRDPQGVAPSELFARSEFPGGFKARTLTFARQPDGRYQTTSNGKSYVLTPGQPAQLDIGLVVLRKDSVPQSFKVKIYDREDAITRLSAHLEATKAGGDIAKVVYRGDDSTTAAAVANAVVAFYLERHRTTDRGVNQRRVEYVSAQVDSTGAELARTERELRDYEERSGVIDPEVVSKLELEGAGDLRHQLTELQVDEGAINQLLSRADSSGVSSGDLAAYPGFLRASAVGPLVNELSELEATRIKLLQRHTERDPDIQTIDQTQRAVRANILAMARSYAGALSKQRTQVQARLDAMQRSILELPAAAERAGRLKRDVTRLTEIFTALQAQLVEARLGAISEGGDVRQVDVAVAQRDPAFPKPMLTMGIGVSGGLVAGMIAAMFLGWFGRWLRDPFEVERAIGVSAQRLDHGTPLFVGGSPSPRTILVVPLDGRARPALVAERLARTARSRSVQATVLDLSIPHLIASGSGTAESIDVNATIAKLEAQNSMVVVQLPDLFSDTTVAALEHTRPVLFVAPPGPVDRGRLAGAVNMLKRLHIPCAGVVLSDHQNGTRALS